MIARRNAAVLAATALVAGLLVGCSNDGPQGDTDPATVEPTGSPSDPSADPEPSGPATDDPDRPADPEEEPGTDPGDGGPGESAVIDIAVPPGTADDGFVGALDDVEVTRCEAGDGWEVAGTVTNPEGSTQTYRIYVSLTAGSDTAALVQVDATVEAGQTQDWATTVPVQRTDLRCVLRVERAAA